MRLIVVLLTGVLLIGTPASLAAQAPVHANTTRKLIISERAIAAGLAASPPVRVQRSRDSVKNGAIAGAVIGGIAAAVVATYFCNAIGEEGDPPCWRGVLAVGAVGAGIGAAAGAGIDAIASHRSPLLHGRESKECQNAAILAQEQTIFH